MKQIKLIGWMSFLLILNSCIFKPSLSKQLYVKEMPKDRVLIIKNLILSEGYERVGKEDRWGEGAFTTFYERDISTDGEKTLIGIGLSYKIDEDRGGDGYRNLGFNVSNYDHAKDPKVKAEINRMESMLYEKLCETAGQTNVVRESGY